MAAAAILAVGLAGCATSPPVDIVSLPFPAPDSGPGSPGVGGDAHEHIEEGWRALRTGDAEAALMHASRAGTSSAARLLELQAALVSGTGDPTAKLADLTAAAPDYAAAWLTLSVAAEQAGREKIALEAARRGAELWPDDRWQDRAHDLRQRWIGDRLLYARQQLAEGDPETAMEGLRRALELAPDSRDARLLEARVFNELGEPDRAEAVLATLPRDREAVMLAGEIAEQRGDTTAAIRIYSSLGDDPEALLAAIELAEAADDWLTAMNLYEQLPDDVPARDAGLRESKLRWRLSVAPPYFHEAMAEEALDRADLAVLMVTLAPALETVADGRVPLLSDIVDMPSQREIITAARLGLLEVDRLEHRFHPEQLVTAPEVRSAIDGLGRILGIESPRWCTDHGSPCVAFEPPISGREVADIIIEMMAPVG